MTPDTMLDPTHRAVVFDDAMCAAEAASTACELRVAVDRLQFFVSAARTTARVMEEGGSAVEGGGPTAEAAAVAFGELLEDLDDIVTAIANRYVRVGMRCFVESGRP
ncbi:MAG: hypothetical protein AAF531_10490 [Actinomycetota bacterium]